MYLGNIRFAVYLGVAILQALVLHEFAHAWAADRLGDPSPRRWGRLTLDPRPLIDPFGSLILPGAESNGLTVLNAYLAHGGTLTDADGQVRLEPASLAQTLEHFQELQANGVLRTYQPDAGTRNVRFVRFIMRSNHGDPEFMDVLEVTVRGVQ